MIVVLDFGSQTSQLIARRIRENQVYSELFPWDTPAETVLAQQPAGIVLSGGPASVYEPDAPQIPSYVLESGLPVLGICYGMQAMTHALGGRVSPSAQREFGHADLHPMPDNPLLPPAEAQGLPVWMSHGDRIESPPQGFVSLAKTAHAPIAAMADLARGYFGVQFHPEVHHTPSGLEILRRFAVDICGAAVDWDPGSIVDQSIRRIREQVGTARVLAGVSGGVDSSVAAALVHRAVGDQLVAVFVDNGLMRTAEPASVVDTFRKQLGVELLAVDAVADFLGALAGVSDPEQKRKIIGERFIRIFEAQARLAGAPKFLVQGTIYPDVVESSAPDRSQAAHIKTHHNVGGLPEDMEFELVEPLRYLFKDEVRAVGLHLGLPEEMVWRQPFPGPGLAVRCLGEVSPERVNKLRAADHIVTQELNAHGLLRQSDVGDGSDQAFAVLLPVRSVGVMGDYRTYEEAIAIRAVTTEDFMTADWARLPQELLARISNRVVNEVAGVNRVVYDITSKPPATIEWE